MLELPLPRENKNEELLKFVISELDCAFHSISHQAISLVSKKGAVTLRIKFISFLASCIKYLWGNICTQEEIGIRIDCIYQLLFFIGESMHIA